MEPARGQSMEKNRGLQNAAGNNCHIERYRNTVSNKNTEQGPSKKKGIVVKDKNHQTEKVHAKTNNGRILRDHSCLTIYQTETTY
jgi:hypothetical protein